MNEQPQGMQLSLAELYQIIGEKEVIRFKLAEENQRLKELVENLSTEKKNG
jgi:hypothetical protein